MLLSGLPMPYFKGSGTQRRFSYQRQKRNPAAVNLVSGSEIPYYTIAGIGAVVMMA
jgi:hypothetical protein